MPVPAERHDHDRQGREVAQQHAGRRPDRHDAEQERGDQARCEPDADELHHDAVPLPMQG